MAHLLAIPVFAIFLLVFGGIYDIWGEITPLRYSDFGLIISGIGLIILLFCAEVLLLILMVSLIFYV